MRLPLLPAGRRAPRANGSLARLRRRAAALVLIAAAALALPGAAAAHTRLERSAPAAGDTVRTLTEVRLVFTRGVEPRYTQIRLVGPGGRAVALGAAREVDGSRGREFVALLAQLPDPGAYRVEWRTAGADGHPVTGTFDFVVARDPALAATGTLPATPAGAVAAPHAAATEDVPPGAEGRPHATPGLERWVRWMDFLALLLAVGATAFVHLVARPVAAEGRHAAVADAVTARAARVALVAGLAMLPALAGRLGVQSALLHGAADTWNADRVATLVGGTQWGIGWLLQAGAACVFLAAAVLAARPATRAAGWALAVPAAAALCAVPALSGHAAAAERLRGLAIAADTLHVAGAGTWLGALAVLLAALPVALRGEEGHAAVAALVNRFSPVALGAAALAGATGVGNALFHLSSPGELTGTTYGRTLLLKVGLLAVVAALGFFNWRRVRPALGTPEAAARLRRSALAEVVVGILVVAVTATLVALPTP